jgi:hypothetical protein
MATESTSHSPKSKDLKNKDGEPTKLVEWATMDANSVDEMIALFGESGVSYSSGEEITGDYKLITGDEKQLFLQRVQGRRTFCVQWEFRTPAGKATASTREFVSVHVVIDGHGKFIVNDSAKGGFYGQLSDITSRRIDTGKSDRESKTGLLATRGFKPNKPFYFDTRTNKAIPRDELENIPEEFRQEAKPTWRLEF